MDKCSKIQFPNDLNYLKIFSLVARAIFTYRLWLCKQYGMKSYYGIKNPMKVFTNCSSKYHVIMFHNFLVMCKYCKKHRLLFTNANISIRPQTPWFFYEVTQMCKCISTHPQVIMTSFIAYWNNIMQMIYLF